MKGITHSAQFQHRTVVNGQSSWGAVFLTWRCHLEPISSRVTLTGAYVTSTHRVIGPYKTPLPQTGDRAMIAPITPTGATTEAFYVVYVSKHVGPSLARTTTTVYLKKDENV